MWQSQVLGHCHTHSSRYSCQKCVQTKLFLCANKVPSEVLFAPGNLLATKPTYNSLQCFVTVSWATERASGLWKMLGVGLLVGTFWLELCTTSIILSSNKIQNGDVLVPAKLSPPGKKAIKTDREKSDLRIGPTCRTNSQVRFVADKSAGENKYTCLLRPQKGKAWGQKVLILQRGLVRQLTVDRSAVIF